jgi:hypothetical protein
MERPEMFGVESCNELSLRTSSAANVGTDKDSDKRQRAAIEAFAKRAGYELLNEFYDAAVSGADPIDSRPGFASMLERIEGNGVRTIIVETASRFARDLDKGGDVKGDHEAARIRPAARRRGSVAARGAREASRAGGREKLAEWKIGGDHELSCRAARKRG